MACPCPLNIYIYTYTDINKYWNILRLGYTWFVVSTILFPRNYFRIYDTYNIMHRRLYFVRKTTTRFSLVVGIFQTLYTGLWCFNKIIKPTIKSGLFGLNTVYNIYIIRNVNRNVYIYIYEKRTSRFGFYITCLLYLTL